MQELIKVWKQWLEQFHIVEDLGNSIEISTTSQLEEIEQENNFILPKDYKNFCEIFGTCSFFQGQRVYSPDIRLSEMFLYSVREEFSVIYETDFSPANISVEMLSKIERILTGSGLVFSDDISAQIYIFDLTSYLEEDESCDIWSTSGEGELDNFSYLGRSFYKFFLRFCIEIDDLLEVSELTVSLPQEKKLLRRFNSSQFINF